MEEAVIKLELFRIIDSFEGKLLQEMYTLLKDFQEKKETEINEILEKQYETMSKDIEREEEAEEWIEAPFKTK